MLKEIYDIAIIGSGPVGLASAMYAGRLDMKTVVFGDLLGGAITLTDIVENYPGFKSISGSELADRLIEHAKEYNAEFIEGMVERVEPYEDVYRLISRGDKYFSKTVLFATGTKHRKLEVPGSEKFERRGVHYCALCDGPLYKDKKVGVVGGSDSAAKEALLLEKYANEVYIIYRGEKIHPEPVNAKRIEKSSKIKIITKTNIIGLEGGDTLSRILLDREYNGQKELELDGLFVAIGGIPRSELAIPLGVAVNKKGEIKIDRAGRTNIEGIFAAGDVVDSEFKQAITGIGEGVAAVYQAYRYINEKEFVCTCLDEEYL
jgi:thioredoxin reductase (NADPH)